MNSLPTQSKIDTVAELTDKLSRAQMALVADYRGLTVAEISDLRKQLRSNGAELIVAKNTLVILAAKATGRDGLEPLLEGPTAVAFAYDDVSGAAKAINDFNKGAKQIAVRGGMLGNSMLDSSALDRVSKLPSRQQVLADILGGVQSPLAGVVGALNGVVANVMYAVQARIDQLQPADEAAA